MGFFSITVKKIRTITRLSRYKVTVPNLFNPFSTGKRCYQITYDITSIGTSTKMILHSHLLGLCVNANVYMCLYYLYIFYIAATVKWSKQEEKEVKEYFSDCYKSNTLPGMKMCLRLIERNKKAGGVLWKR